MKDLLLSNIELIRFAIDRALSETQQSMAYDEYCALKEFRFELSQYQTSGDCP